MLGPPSVGDFGFFHRAEDVETAVDFLRHFHILPGQWTNEESGWIEDLRTWIAIESRIAWEVKKGINSDTEESAEGDFRVEIE